MFAVGWLRRSDAAQRSMAAGWLERARRTALATHGVASADTSRAPGSPATGRRARVDDDERALAGYNAWLRGLAEHRSAD